jgi:hypothetical protein
MRVFTAALSLAALSLAGCIATTPTTTPKEPPQSNRLTTGQVQLTLHRNQTTQTEVLEAFGAPNLVTVNSEGEEVWTYQRNATVVNSQSSNAFGTVIFFGGSTQSSGLEQSSRTMTLIVKFKTINGAKRVSSFDSRTSSF